MCRDQERDQMTYPTSAKDGEEEKKKAGTDPQEAKRRA
jgi:hypothetical protein